MLCCTLGVLLSTWLGACSRTGDPAQAAALQPSSVQLLTDADSEVGHIGFTERAPLPTPLADASPGPPSNANVVLITVDSMRADMPWAGYARPIAPRLTELESRAVSYTRGYAASSYTSMSVGGLLSGKLPSETWRDGYFFGAYSTQNNFFPQILAARGVHTMAVHGHGYFKKGGFERGFSEWRIVPDLKWNNTTDENITSPQIESIAEELLGDAKCDTSRFFAWFHFMDPHDRYMTHEGVTNYGKSLRDKYDAEVEFTDRQIGKLLDFIAARPWSARTAIIVSADHGEAFGEHGQHAHGFELWENLVHVPLFIVSPGAKARRISEPRGALDVAPTILAYFGIEPAADMRGKSLLPEIYGIAPEPRDVVVDLPPTSDNDRRRALTHGNYKLIAFGATAFPKVFDLARDPGEATPLSKSDPAYADMVSRYAELAMTIKDIPPTRCKEGCLNGGYRTKK